MSAALLSALREPPVVGRFYMVPTVRYFLSDLTDDWPVLGPRHHDAGDLDFPHWHFHLDSRFLSKRQWATLRRRRPELSDETLVNGVVLSEAFEGWRAMHGTLPKKTSLRRRKCRSTDQPYTAYSREEILLSRGNKIEKRFGLPAKAVRLADGRILCPHRKLDLSTFEPDENGIVTCPLHGLRVFCGAEA